MREKLRPIHFLLLLPLVGTVLWIGWRAREVRDDPAAVLQALRSARGPQLPTAATAGASGRTEPAAYGRDTLYELIDGAAESYLGPRFSQCVAATYTWEGGDEADAELYRFETAAGAAGQLEAERPAAAVPVAGVAKAWTDGQQLLAVAGNEYLKVTGFGEADAMRPRLAALAAAWHTEVAR